MKKLLFSIVIGILGEFCFSEESLSPQIIKKLNASVFEVVVEKNENDTLSYEKPLPYDKLPYATRTSKYDSIGTAFLMSDGNFYTAQHVFHFTVKSLHGDFYIRKADQSVYKVDKILKCSADRDFVIFSVKDFVAEKDAGLEFEENLELNSQVYAVGNAQGEGIIIRNGLYTSETPENRDGEWKWLRFSAAASPGNSGGPLVTTDGKVAGIITMKNGSENLNYALPVKELKNVKDNTGVFHLRHVYGIANIENLRESFDMDFTIELPKDIDEFKNIAYEKYYEFTKNVFEGIRTKYGIAGTENVSKKEPGCDLLNFPKSIRFPEMVCRDSNNKWNSYYPKDIEEVNLDDNGVLYYGSIAGFTLFKYKMHDSQKIKDLLENPKVMMDDLIVHYGFTRSFAGEKITVTSLGTPTETFDHVDAHGRKWLVDFYAVPFVDAGILCYKIPVPDGFVILFKLASYSSVSSGLLLDLEFISDYIIIPYDGKISQWKEYLALDESVYPKHEFLKGLSFDLTKNKFVIDSNFCSAEISEKDLKIEENDTVDLSIRLVADEKKGFHNEICAIGISIDENENSETYLLAGKSFEPHKKASKSVKDDWKVKESKSMPFTNSVIEDGKAVFIAKVVKEQKGSLCYVFLEKSSLEKKNLKKIFEKLQKSISFK